MELSDQKEKKYFKVQHIFTSFSCKKNMLWGTFTLTWGQGRGIKFLISSHPVGTQYIYLKNIIRMVVGLLFRKIMDQLVFPSLT